VVKFAGERMQAVAGDVVEMRNLAQDQDSSHQSLCQYVESCEQEIQGLTSRNEDLSDDHERALASALASQKSQHELEMARLGREHQVKLDDKKRSYARDLAAEKEEANQLAAAIDRMEDELELFRKWRRCRNCEIDFAWFDEEERNLRCGECRCRHE
jgi:hypothetical protein